MPANRMFVRFPPALQERNQGEAKQDDKPQKRKNDVCRYRLQRVPEPSFLLPCKVFCRAKHFPQYDPPPWGIGSSDVRGSVTDPSVPTNADQRRSEDEDGDGDDRGEPVRLNDADW